MITVLPWVLNWWGSAGGPVVRLQPTLGRDYSAAKIDSADFSGPRVVAQGAGAARLLTRDRSS